MRIDSARRPLPLSRVEAAVRPTLHVACDVIREASSGQSDPDLDPSAAADLPVSRRPRRRTLVGGSAGAARRYESRVPTWAYRPETWNLRLDPHELMPLAHRASLPAVTQCRTVV
jgi:hypothetical protein